MSGPNGTLRMAFEDGMITDHDGWRRMGKARNTVSHIYNKEEAQQIVGQIFNEYGKLLKDLDIKLSEQANKEIE